MAIDTRSKFDRAASSDLPLKGIYPKLKADRMYWRAGVSQSLRIGNRFEHHPLPESIGEIQIAAILSLCDGRRNIIEIANAASAEPELIATILEEIGSLGFLELLDGRSISDSTSGKDRGANSLSNSNYRERFAIELENVSARNLVSPSQILKSRASFHIEIFGTGRIADNLSANLIAVGYSNTLINNRRHPSHPSHRVRATDICGLQFTEGDIGKMKARLFEDIRERARLFPRDSIVTADKGDPNLAIIIGAPAPDTQQELLSRGIPHLLVDFAASNQVRIGPYVEDVRRGSSGDRIDGPCINCIALAESEFGAPPIATLDNEIEVGAGLTMAACGLTALTVMEISDTGKCNLRGQTALLTISRYFEPLLTIWQRHPACGCNWL